MNEDSWDKHIRTLSELIEKGINAYDNLNYKEALNQAFLSMEVIDRIAQILKKETYIKQSKAINPVDLTYCYPKRVERFFKTVKMYKKQLKIIDNYSLQNLEKTSNNTTDKVAKSKDLTSFKVYDNEAPPIQLKDYTPMEEEIEEEIIYEKNDVEIIMGFLYELLHILRVLLHNLKRF